MTILEGILYMMWRGFAIGVIISAPMGPVGILCVQRTLSKGRKTGLYTGIGAAISDLFYCLLTGFGLSFIEEFLEENQNMIQLVGSAVLIGFAAYLFFSNPSKSIRKPGENPGSPKLGTLHDNRPVRTVQLPVARYSVRPLSHRIPVHHHRRAVLVVGGYILCGQGTRALQPAQHVAHQ